MIARLSLKDSEPRLAQVDFTECNIDRAGSRSYCLSRQQLAASKNPGRFNKFAEWDGQQCVSIVYPFDYHSWLFVRERPAR